MEASSSPHFVLSNLSCTNLVKSCDPINTGVGYFDHMIDQLNSHAQIGVSVTVTSNILSSDLSDRNRYASPIEHQVDLMSLVGAGLGSSIRSILESSTCNENETKTSRFCCPLDEALVECILTARLKSATPAELKSFTLPPYGIFPPVTGRTKIGRMSTSYLNDFFSSLSQSMGVDIELKKIRGDNGHHVVESAFKAFSRALRNLIDGVDTETNTTLLTMDDIWKNASSDDMRSGRVQRKTKETSILVDLDLSPSSISPHPFNIDTGVDTMDRIVKEMATHADITHLIVECKGDLYVDDHHTCEDVAIALGQVIDKALGTKAGLNRMWTSRATERDATVEVVMDLSNRPCLTHNLSLQETNEEFVGDMSIEMMEHFFESLVINSRMTVHMIQQKTVKPPQILNVAVATARAFGKAFAMCAAVDPRRAGKTASSKGTLSV